MKQLAFYFLVITSLYSLGTDAQSVDYAQIGKDISDNLQHIAADRNARKAHYFSVYSNTKSSIVPNTVLTNDYDIDRLIFQLQKDFNNRFDMIYRLLTNGLLKENLFEGRIRSTYSAYVNANRSLTYLSKLKSQNYGELNYEQRFKKVLNHISGFKISDYGEVSFLLTDIQYSGSNDLNSLYDYVSKYSINNSSYNQAISLYEDKKRKEREQKEKELKIVEDWINAGNTLIKKRGLRLSKLDKKAKRKYLKSEYRYLKSVYSEELKSYKDMFGSSSKLNNETLKLLVNQIRTKLQVFKSSQNQWQINNARAHMIILTNMLNSLMDFHVSNNQ